MALEPYPQAPFFDSNSGWVSIPWQLWFNQIIENIGTGGGGAVDSVFGRTGAVVAVANDYSHAQISGVGANDHHNEVHNIASHSDTTATGAELNTLTNGSDADALHIHGSILWEVSGGNAQLKVSRDIDFQNKKAIAMLADGGDTLPASPVEGRWFRHTPIGRTILYLYDGSSFLTSSMQSFGSMTVFVDNTDGTDSLDNGFAVDTDAFKTIPFAINVIPGLIGGDVLILPNDETFVEVLTFQGKSATGNFTATLRGTLALEETVTSATVVQNGSAVQGTVTKAGAFTGDSYAGFLAYFVTDDDWRIIDTHTNDVLTLIARAPSSTTQDVEIYSWGTVINSGATNDVEIKNGQLGIVLEDIEFTKRVNPSGLSKVNVVRCHLLDRLQIQEGSIGNMDRCWSESAIAINSITGSNGACDFSKLINNGGAFGVRADPGSAYILSFGTVIDGYVRGSNAISTSIRLDNGSVGFLRIRNCTTGILGSNNGVHVAGNTPLSNIQFSGNSTNASPSLGSTDFSHTGA